MKRNLLLVTVGSAVVMLVFIVQEKWRNNDFNETISPSPSLSASVSPVPTVSPTRDPNLVAKNTYDNQDALFTYTGVDHPARNILWKVSPEDTLSIGPNIYEKLPLPDGQSLLGISLPAQPKYRRYELTASVEYGRYEGTDNEGAIRVRTAACKGKTVVVIPDSIQF